MGLHYFSSLLCFFTSSSHSPSSLYLFPFHLFLFIFCFPSFPLHSFLPYFSSSTFIHFLSVPTSGMSRPFPFPFIAPSLPSLHSTSYPSLPFSFPSFMSLHITSLAFSFLHLRFPLSFRQDKCLSHHQSKLHDTKLRAVRNDNKTTVRNDM